VQMKPGQLALDLKTARRPTVGSDPHVDVSGLPLEARLRDRGPHREHMSMNPRSVLSVRGTQPPPPPIGELMKCRDHHVQAQCIAAFQPPMVSLAAVLKGWNVPAMRRGLHASLETKRPRVNLVTLRVNRHATKLCTHRDLPMKHKALGGQDYL